ncbi:hypothetical protein V493_05635 [Pseudogymnoascus sp. VKM F-4281 (FW-2241)]|nr:hypothetical protein V493_05635 [Pseudogymnoascus sp. VKM F-4281 (FW-2241)]
MGNSQALAGRSRREREVALEGMSRVAADTGMAIVQPPSPTARQRDSGPYLAQTPRPGPREPSATAMMELEDVVAAGRTRRGRGHDYRSHRHVVGALAASLTWAETDMPCCEQS